MYGLPTLQYASMSYYAKSCSAADCWHDRAVPATSGFKGVPDELAMTWGLSTKCTGRGTFSSASFILAKCASLWNVRARLLAASVLSRSVPQNSARHTSVFSTVLYAHCTPGPAVRPHFPCHYRTSVQWELCIWRGPTAHRNRLHIVASYDRTVTEMVCQVWAQHRTHTAYSGSCTTKRH